MKHSAVLSAGVILATALTISAQTLKVTATNGVGAACAAVMWITDAANAFQRTFGIWDSRDSDHLKVWNSVKPNSTVDGTTGATISVGASFNATWNGKGSTGALVANGTYKYFIEICKDGPTPQHIVGSIVVDGTSKTKNGIDSGTSAGATSLTNVSAVYTAPITGVVKDEKSRLNSADPFEIFAPAGFAGGPVSVQLVSFDGKVLWHKRTSVAAQGSIRLSRNDFSAAATASGARFIVADFAGVKTTRALAPMF
jgi:hypothetical protein